MRDENILANIYSLAEVAHKLSINKFPLSPMSLRVNPRFSSKLRATFARLEVSAFLVLCKTHREKSNFLDTAGSTHRVTYFVNHN